MASPTLETTNLHAALGGMSLQNAPGAGTSPTAQPASILQQDTSTSTQSQPAMTSQKHDPTNEFSSSGEKIAQHSNQTNTPMPQQGNATSSAAAPSRKKFVYDPSSMLLPHERLAQQRAGAHSQPVSNSHPLSRQHVGQAMPSSQTQVIAHHNPPPSYLPNNTGYGHASASHQMAMPTRAAPPLPPSSNGRPSAQAKQDIFTINRNQPWTDPDAVDPLQSRPPGTADKPLSDEDSGGEEGSEGRTGGSRGKKRVRSEGTASIAGSTSHADKKGASASRITKNAGPALLTDWEIVETLGEYRW